MKTVKYVPTICKAEGSEWSGHVTLRGMTFDEKYDYMEAMGIGIDDDGNVDTGAKKDRIKQSRQLVNLSEVHYVEVNFKNKAGESVKSFKEMKEEPEFFETLVEIAMFIIGGLKVGNA